MEICESEAGAWVVCNACEDSLGGVAWEIIVTENDLLKTRLLCNELSKKVYVSRYVLEPWSIVWKIKFCDGVNIGRKEAFKQDFTYVHTIYFSKSANFGVIIYTE